MGTIIGDYIGPTIGIHSPIPYEAPDSLARSTLKPRVPRICPVPPFVGPGATAQIPKKTSASRCPSFNKHLAWRCVPEDYLATLTEPWE